jgi:hypothetical protein
MSTYPSLDAYDLQGVDADEIAQYADETRTAFDELDRTDDYPYGY